MKNTVDSVESGQMTSQMTQQQAQQPEIGFHLPPPYSAEQILFPNWAPNGSNATLNLFNQALGNNERFIFAPIGRFGFATRTIIVQLQDTARRPLLSIMTVPGQNISTGHNNHNSIRVGSVMQITNQSGQTLLTARENGQVCTAMKYE